jgi:hypothetical protein
MLPRHATVAPSIAALADLHHQGMPWTPPSDDRPPLNPRAEACRDQAARLHRGRRSVVLYCRVDTEWTRLGGHLWWRRWSAPRYRLEQHWLEDGESNNFVTSGEALERALDDLDRGLYVLQGESWRVQWLDEHDSRAFREEHGFEVYRR